MRSRVYISFRIEAIDFKNVVQGITPRNVSALKASARPSRGAIAAVWDGC